MPCYDYRCTACGETFEAYSVPNADEITCIYCGKPAQRTWLTPPAIDTPSEYYDDGLGCVITSPRHRHRILRERGLKECGDRVGGMRLSK